MKILAVCTCFNRKDKTKECIETITSCNPGCEFTFVVADDGSTDGTVEMLMQMQNEYRIHIVKGDGTWFYSGGMHAGMEYAKEKLSKDFSYMLLINDDVEFLNQCILQMIDQSKEQRDAVIVGTMKDKNGMQSYGAIKYIHGYKYRRLNISEWQVEADTFNANCVLVPYKVFEQIGSMDSFYRHSLGDFDYGLSLKRAGYKIYQSKDFVGVCNNNSKDNTWNDTSLGRIERIRKKESVKGAPTKQWFYFLKKNFNLGAAVKGCITPYIRIIVGR